jgi:cobalt-zinc-cadmium efflux system outer membrane protein
MKTILRAALLAVTFLSAGAANADTLTLEEAIRQSVANSPLGAAATARGC